MNNINDRKKAMLLMAITAVLWSIAGIFIKLISWNPLMIAGCRSLISGFIMLLYMKYRSIPFNFCKESAGAGIGLGLSATLFVMANKLTTAANAIVLQYSAPIFILIITALVLKRTLRRREIIVVSITMVGIVLFFFDQLSPGNILGNILGILAGIFLALMFVSMGEGGDDDSIRMSGILMAHALAAALGMPVGIALTSSVTGTEILFVVILGVFQLGIPYVLYAIASKDCPPLACSLIGMLEPLLNPVWVAIFDGEMPGPFALAGGAVIIATVGWWCAVDSKE